MEIDATCNTKYMLSAIERAGKALREKMNEVSMEDDVYLIMENAGGRLEE